MLLESGAGSCRNVPDQPIEVGTGEVFTVAGAGLLRASALGSCVCIVVCDPQSRVGAMAHVMLPGTAPPSSLHPNRYAVDAIRTLLNGLSEYGVRTTGLMACLVGAANVLQRPDDTICESNIACTRQILRDQGITISAESLGGVLRRAVCLDVARGLVQHSQGDSPEETLFVYRRPESGDSGRGSDGTCPASRSSGRLDSARANDSDLFHAT